MHQNKIELILLRQWASYMTMPIWIADSEEKLLYCSQMGLSTPEVGDLIAGYAGE